MLSQWCSKGGGGGGPPRAAHLGGQQNRTFGVDEMVRKKVFECTENFWVRRKFFRVRRGKNFRVGRIEQRKK